MDQKKTYVKPESLDISLEDFDSLEGKHEFSKEYKKNKKKMLKEYRKLTLGAPKRTYVKAAVAAAFLLVVTPTIAYAATDGEFFNRIWGNAGRESIASHDEVVYDNEKGTSYTVTYPKREYENIDPDKADELIGKHVSSEPITQNLGDTELTILSSVCDGNSAVVEFTLKRKGGVNAFHYSQLDNESKGAWFSDDATFWFTFTDCHENIYVDMEKSTEDTLYCYDYMTTESGSNAPEKLTLKIEQYPCTRGELHAADDEAYKKYMADTTIRHISLPINSQVETAEYVNADGGSIFISPLSIKIDMSTGLGLSGDEAADPWGAYYTSINYKDGKKYIVLEHDYRDIHSCDVEIDNTSYACGDLQNNLTYVFNRLVDIDSIESITVNKTTYTLK